MTRMCGSVGQCLTPVSGFFTQPKNQLSLRCSRASFIDKVLKTADPLFDLAGTIAESSGASHEVVQGIGKGRAAVKTGRDILGIFNIFQGSIAALVINLKNIFHLITSSENAVTMKNDGHYHSTVSGTGEKVAYALENVGKGVGAATYIFAFGASRPIANYEKYISKNIDPTASQIGKAFPTIMMVNHIGGVVAHSSALVFHNLAFDRISTGEHALQGDELAGARSEYEKKITENAVALAEKGLELVADVVHHVGHAAPAGVRIPLFLTIGALGVTREWLKD